MAEFDSVIPPGGVGKVTASVKTDHFKGPISKAVTVTSNDPEHASVSLQIKADVKVAIDVTPTESVYLQGRVGDIKPTELTLASTDGNPFDILEVQKTQGNPTVTVKVAPPPAPAETAADAAAAKGKPAAKPERAKVDKAKAKTDKGAKAEPAVAAAKPVASGSSRYLVTIGPDPTWETGRKNATVVLTTSHPKQPTITLYVNANLQGEVVVNPERVSLIAKPNQPTPTDLLQHVKVSKATGTALAIEKVESSDPDIATKLTTVSEGREYDLEVRYTGKPGRGVVTANVTVTTNEAKQKTIVIPVVGRT